MVTEALDLTFRTNMRVVHMISLTSEMSFLRLPVRYGQNLYSKYYREWCNITSS